MPVELYNQPSEGWDDFVLDCPESKIYHLSRWNELIRSTFGRSVKYLTLEDNSSLKAVLPLTEFDSRLFGRFSVSLPFINYGGALISDGEANYSQIWQFLNTYRKNGNFSFVELRMDNPIETQMPVKTHKVTFLLDLPDDPDELWKSFKAKLRNQIRRPTKEDMYAVSGQTEILDDFFKVYSQNMRDLGTPALPRKFFRNILTTFRDNTAIVCVYSKEKLAVAASFLIYFKDRCEIPWASSIKEYNRFSPNMLLYWESLKFAIDKELKIFDFGRCTPGSGTYQFKKQWGAEEKQLYWYYVLRNGESPPEINPDNPKYKWLIHIWRKFPVSLVNIISPSIIKNIP